MEILLLSKKIKFRIENANGKQIVFCYDVRTDTYFAMNPKYFSALQLLQQGITYEELCSRCDGINCDVLVRGLLYRCLLDCKHEGSND